MLLLPANKINVKKVLNAVYSNKQDICMIINAIFGVKH